MTDWNNRNLGDALPDLFTNDDLPKGYCASCGETVDPNPLTGRCPRCKGILISEAAPRPTSR